VEGLSFGKSDLSQSYVQGLRKVIPRRELAAEKTLRK